MKQIFILFLLLTTFAIGYTKDIVVPYTLADRDRIMRMEEKLIAIDQRFDSIDKRFDNLTALMTGIIAVMGAMVTIFIGLLVWDRRSALKPFELKLFEDKLKSTDVIVADNSEKTSNLLEALRALSKDDPKVASVLGRFHLL